MLKLSPLNPGPVPMMSWIETHHEVTISVLQCVTETGDGNSHMLKGVLIRALSDVLSQRPMWRESGDALFRAFDDIDYQEQIDLAHQDARVGVSTPLSALIRRLGDWLGEGAADQLAQDGCRRRVEIRPGEP
jgi:hypothetical protein